jgi:uncharacterized DUF497 family protein
LTQDWFAKVQGFEWDEGNAQKNVSKHGVTNAQCEELFLNAPLIVLADESHSGHEPRFKALGHSNDGLTLFVAFTVRRTLIRVISARPMSRQERRIYEKAQEAPQVQERS